MADEKHGDPPEGPTAPADGSSAAPRDEGDSAVPEPAVVRDVTVSPEFVVESFRRLARQRSGDSDRALEIARLVETRGFDPGTLAALSEFADTEEERGYALIGLARALRRLKPNERKETP